MVNKLSLNIIKRLIRPFTLLYPAIAVLSGGILAFNLSTVPIPSDFIIKIILGMLIASSLNASSNIINQLYDIEIDRINKPERVLPKGEITKLNAALIGMGFCAFGLIMAFLISFPFFILCSIAMICTSLYSIPPIRLKRFHWYANLTMAVPRGLLLIVAGWATVAPINAIEPWLFGSVLFFFILGANTAKDYADIKGDRFYGIETIPIKYGVEKATKIIKPFFIFPFTLIIIYCVFGWLHWLFLGVIIFTLPGYKAINLIEKTPDKTAIDDNHPSWKMMYLLVSGYTLFIAILSFFIRWLP